MKKCVKNPPAWIPFHYLYRMLEKDKANRSLLDIALMSSSVVIQYLTLPKLS
jgi:hypothetical protein